MKSTSPNQNAVLVRESVGEDGSYSGVFTNQGLEFTVEYVNSMYRLAQSASNPKRPRWWIESAGRQCQTAAYERVTALGPEFQRKHVALYSKV
jgi:hypothetical protein